MMLIVLLFLHLTGYDAIAYRLAGCQFVLKDVAGPGGDVVAVKRSCR